MRNVTVVHAVLVMVRTVVHAYVLTSSWSSSFALEIPAYLHQILDIETYVA